MIKCRGTYLDPGRWTREETRLSAHNIGRPAGLNNDKVTRLLNRQQSGSTAGGFVKRGRLTRICPEKLLSQVPVLHVHEPLS